jgi:drug/metabolite transporter (DMT)-like permease
VYFLAKAYEIGELSHVYTIARGLPPVMVLALAGWAVGEIPDVTGLAGVAMISIGILVVGMTRGAHLQGTRLALIVAVCIAVYTISDGIGVRVSGSVVAYNGWAFFSCAAVCMTMSFVLRGRKVFSYARIHWRRAVFGGVLSFVSYGLVLWAMTQASIAGISALRETSVVFAAVIGMLFLGEKAGAQRIAGALIVACGALLLKLG